MLYTRSISNKLFSVFVLLFLASLGRSDVIFNNLTIDNSNTASVTETSWRAQSFKTDNQSYFLNQITVSMFRVSGSSDAVLRIFDNDATNPLFSVPGNALYTLTSPGSYTTNPTLSDTIFTGSSNLLNANTTYWVVLSAGSGSQFRWSYAINNENSGPGENSAFQTNNADTADSGVNWFEDSNNPYRMKIEVTPVPEPGTMALGAIALASGGMGNWWRRKRKASAENLN